MLRVGQGATDVDIQTQRVGVVPGGMRHPFAAGVHRHGERGTWRFDPQLHER